MLRRLPPVQTDFDAFPLGGGLDTNTPPLNLKPGVCRDAVNWECSTDGGYTRIPGYERFDGRPAPSNAIPTVLLCELNGTAFAVGETLNGQTSGATGVCAAISGNYVVVTKVTGTFVDGENLRRTTTVLGTITTVGPIVADQAALGAFTLAAQNIYRADITAVPGSGPVRGVVFYNNTLYAVRNNSGGTAALWYKHTTGGWSLLSFGFVLGFSAGTGAAPAEGASVTKGAVSAVVRRVLVRTGTFAGGNAVGTFIIDAPTGGSFTAGAFTAGVTANCAGAEAPVSFASGGRFEFRIDNVGNGTRVYGVDGINKAFEFDGTVMAPIPTGMTTDTPQHLNTHQRKLFLSFLSSVQNSGDGLPFSWTVVTGANEVVVSSNVTNMITVPGSENNPTMVIFSEDGIAVLYGATVASFKLSPLNFGTTGARPYSAQPIQQCYFYDVSGVRSLFGIQAFGNFDSAPLTQNIRGFLASRMTSLTETLLNTTKFQYRMFFSDGSGLFLTIVNRKLLGAMPMAFPVSVFCACRGLLSGAGEVSYIGATDGFVYQLDKGTSFDGAAINSMIQLTFANQGNARAIKTYNKAVLEVQGDGYHEFAVAFDLAYGSDEVEQSSSPMSVVASNAAVYWDAFTWDEFIWDGRSLLPSAIDFDGDGENIAMRVTSNSALWSPITLNSVILHYKRRRILW